MESWKDTNPITFLTIIVALLVLVTAYQFYLITYQDNRISELSDYADSLFETQVQFRQTVINSFAETSGGTNLGNRVDKLEKSLGSHTGDIGMPSYMNKHHTH
tara:strand:+ start:1295 stop:1603 length:309 start_codon:yes stop_codon:yes gene_type:complete